jgi:hypothetical protein
MVAMRRPKETTTTMIPKMNGILAKLFSILGNLNRNTTGSGVSRTSKSEVKDAAALAIYMVCVCKQPISGRSASASVTRKWNGSRDMKVIITQRFKP